MIETLEKIYKGYGFDDVVGISYFEKFLDELKDYSFAELLAYQSKRYPISYVVAFLLSTPSLWTHLSDLEWIEIMKFMNPRPDPLKSIDLDNGDFADIYFLNKYIRVNSIEVFLNQDNFSILDKNHVIKYCKRTSYSLLLDELDLEDLDGNYFISEKEIKNIQLRLTSNNLFNDFNLTEDEFILYLQSMVEME